MRATFPRKTFVAAAVVLASFAALATPAGAVTDITGHFTAGTFVVHLGTDVTFEIGEAPVDNPCTDDPYPAPEVVIQAEEVFPFGTQITHVDFAPVFVQYPAATGDWWRLDLTLGDAFDNQGFISPSGTTFQDLGLVAEVTDLGPDPDAEDCLEGELACTYYVFAGGLQGTWLTLPPSQGDDVDDYNGQGFAFVRDEDVEDCRPGMVVQIPNVVWIDFIDIDFTSLP